MTEQNFYLEDIPLQQALARIMKALRDAHHWQPLSGESIPLSEALDRVTAEPVWAKNIVTSLSCRRDGWVCCSCC